MYGSLSYLSYLWDLEKQRGGRVISKSLFGVLSYKRRASFMGIFILLF